MVRTLTLSGVQVIGDMPDKGMLVIVAKPTDVSALGVNYAAAIPPDAKVSPLIASIMASAPRKRSERRGSRARPEPLARGYFIVEFHPDTDMNRARGTLLNLGIVPLENPDL